MFVFIESVRFLCILNGRLYNFFLSLLNRAKRLEIVYSYVFTIFIFVFSYTFYFILFLLLRDSLELELHIFVIMFILHLANNNF